MTLPSDPTTVRIEIHSSGDHEADAIALIADVMRWLPATDDTASQRVATYVADRWGP